MNRYMSVEALIAVAPPCLERDGGGGGAEYVVGHTRPLTVLYLAVHR